MLNEDLSDRHVTSLYINCENNVRKIIGIKRVKELTSSLSLKEIKDEFLSNLRLLIKESDTILKVSLIKELPNLSRVIFFL